MRRDELEKHPRSNLIDLIQQHNIRGYSKLNKTQLIDLIIKNKSKIDFSKLLPTSAEQKELKKFLKEQDKKDAMKKAKEAKKIDLKKRQKKTTTKTEKIKKDFDKKMASLVAKQKIDPVNIEDLLESPPPSPKPKKKKMLFVRPKITEGEKKGDFQTAKEMTAVKTTPKKFMSEVEKLSGKTKEEFNKLDIFTQLQVLPLELREKILGKTKMSYENIYEKMRDSYNTFNADNLLITNQDAFENMFWKTGKNSIMRKPTASQEKIIEEYQNIYKIYFRAVEENIKKVFGEQQGEEMMDNLLEQEGDEYSSMLDGFIYSSGYKYRPSLYSRGVAPLITEVDVLDETDVAGSLKEVAEEYRHLFVYHIGSITPALKELKLNYEVLMDTLMKISVEQFGARDITLENPELTLGVVKEMRAETRAKAKAKAKAETSEIKKGSNLSSLEEVEKDGKELTDAEYQKKYGFSKKTMATQNINKTLKNLGSRTKWSRNRLTMSSFNKVMASAKEKNDISEEDFTKAYFDLVRKKLKIK